MVGASHIQIDQISDDLPIHSPVLFSCLAFIFFHALPFVCVCVFRFDLRLSTNENENWNIEYEYEHPENNRIRLLISPSILFIYVSPILTLELIAYISTLHFFEKAIEN